MGGGDGQRVRECRYELQLPGRTRQSLASGPSRSSQSNMITQANTAPRTERPLTEIVGVGLRELYAEVLTEPLPGEFAPLIERLPRRTV